MYPNNTVLNIGELNITLCVPIVPFDINGNGNILHNGLAKGLCLSFKILFNKYVKNAIITKPTKNNKPFTIELCTIESIIMKNVNKKGDIIAKNVNKFVSVNVIDSSCFEIFNSVFDVGSAIINLFIILNKYINYL